MSFSFEYVCASPIRFIRLYLEVIAGDANLMVPATNQRSEYIGSDRIIVNCSATASDYEFYVFTPAYETFAYYVPAYFSLYAMPSESAGWNVASPFDTATSLNYISIGDLVPASLAYGETIYFLVDYTVPVFLCLFNLSVSTSTLEFYVSSMSPLPRSYDASSTALITSSVSQANWKLPAALAYVDKSTINMLTVGTTRAVKLCSILSDCEYVVGFHNAGLPPISFSFSILSEYKISSGVSYGPFTRLKTSNNYKQFKLDNYVIDCNSLATTTEYLHGFLEVKVGEADLFIDSQSCELPGSDYVKSPLVCDANNQVTVQVRIYLDSTIYYLQVEGSATDASLPSPFDKTETVTWLSLNVESPPALMVTSTYEFFAFKYQQGLTNGLYIFTDSGSCQISMRLFSDTKLVRLYDSNANNVDIILTDSNVDYSLAWQLTNVLVAGMCSDISNCNLTVSVYTYYGCNETFFRLLVADGDMTTATSPPLSSPTQRPTRPTQHPTLRPTRPTPQPTAKPTHPTPQPTAKATLSPTTGPTYYDPPPGLDEANAVVLSVGVEAGPFEFNDKYDIHHFSVPLLPGLCSDSTDDAVYQLIAYMFVVRGDPQMKVDGRGSTSDAMPGTSVSRFHIPCANASWALAITISSNDRGTWAYYIPPQYMIAVVVGPASDSYLPYPSTPFDNLEPIHYLATDSVDSADTVTLHIGDYAYYSFPYRGHPINIIARGGVASSAGSGSWVMVTLIALSEDRLPREYDHFGGALAQSRYLSGPITNAGPGINLTVYTIDDSLSLDICGSQLQCDIVFAIKNTEIVPITVSIEVASVRNHTIIPGTRYGPYSSLAEISDEYQLTGVCPTASDSSARYAHIFVDVSYKDVRVRCGNHESNFFGSEYLLINSSLCSDDGTIRCKVIGDENSVYELEYLVSSDNAYSVSSPFDNFVNPTILQYNTESETLSIDSSYVFLKFAYKGPVGIVLSALPSTETAYCSVSVSLAYSVGSSFIRLYDVIWYYNSMLATLQQQSSEYVNVMDIDLSSMYPDVSSCSLSTCPVTLSIASLEYSSCSEARQFRVLLADGVVGTPAPISSPTMAPTEPTMGPTISPYPTSHPTEISYTLDNTNAPYEDDQNLKLVTFEVINRNPEPILITEVKTMMWAHSSTDYFSVYYSSANASNVLVADSTVGTSANSVWTALVNMGTYAINSATGWVDIKTNVIIPRGRTYIFALICHASSSSMFATVSHQSNIYTIHDVDLLSGGSVGYGDDAASLQLQIPYSSFFGAVKFLLVYPVPTVPPTTAPTVKSSANPSLTPVVCPTTAPTSRPTTAPTAFPSIEPSMEPSESPTTKPTYVPTSPPSSEPTTSPTTGPSSDPTSRPSEVPTVLPSASPTVIPSSGPSTSPTVGPSADPTVIPTVLPTAVPTRSPTLEPSSNPSSHPTETPTALPSVTPSVLPSGDPTTSPTLAPSTEPTLIPTLLPSVEPALAPPTDLPTIAPIRSPTLGPSSDPSGNPTEVPTARPSTSPTVLPSGDPTTSPTTVPSTEPPLTPTGLPTGISTWSPTSGPSSVPTRYPSEVPTALPSATPSLFPSGDPTTSPTTAPSNEPALAPSSSPTVVPTMLPTSGPSPDPTSHPTEVPTALPSTSLAVLPSSRPTASPTANPFAEQNLAPIGSPAVVPTRLPTSGPSPDLSSRPTVMSTSSSTGSPSNFPIFPTGLPIVQPSDAPTFVAPTLSTSIPTAFPNVVPSLRPTSSPTSAPTPPLFKSVEPTISPTASPLLCPTARPSAVHISVSPSLAPICSSAPSATRAPVSSTQLPTVLPSATPSSVPMAMPTTAPSSVAAKTSTPTALKPSTKAPVGQTSPTTAPQSSIIPTAGPTSSPTSSNTGVVE
jgi:hypothetical protein